MCAWEAHRSRRGGPPGVRVPVVAPPLRLPQRQRVKHRAAGVRDGLDLQRRARRMHARVAPPQVDLLKDLHAPRVSASCMRQRPARVLCCMCCGDVAGVCGQCRSPRPRSRDSQWHAPASGWSCVAMHLACMAAIMECVHCFAPTCSVTTCTTAAVGTAAYGSKAPRVILPKAHSTLRPRGAHHHSTAMKRLARCDQWISQSTHAGAMTSGMSGRTSGCSVWTLIERPAPALPMTRCTGASGTPSSP